RATRSAWRSRHSSPAPPVPAARRATAARQSPSCAEQKSAWGHSRRCPKGQLRQLWGSAPALLRACARHHSSCVTLRLRFNLLPQPGVSIIRAAPHDPVVTAAAAAITREAQHQELGSALYVEAVAAQLAVHLLRNYASVTFREPSHKG